MVAVPKIPMDWMYELAASGGCPPRSCLYVVYTCVNVRNRDND